MSVAVRAAGLVCATKHTRVLDVGSGIGKMCAIGALSAAGTWVGVEQHGSLVNTATELARLLGVADRTHFLHADAFAVDWNEYDALYFYNPFELTVFGEGSLPSQSIQAAHAQQRLAALPNCTRVVTFHGFGGVMPATFDLLYHERTAPLGLSLALWIQRTSRASTSATA
ncbi:MAG: hypothetical protein HOV81_29515 [Kofleriaceae bacterium]|nr:hypothetical protein [Kofleriaceae bacterium]